MNNLTSVLKGKKLHSSVQNTNAVNMDIQPFKEMPSINNVGHGNADRMNAHDLFSHYTVYVIKEDIIYAR